jgi:hypothetical protein
VFDVFIDGGLDPSPQGAARLAAQIASRFGIAQTTVAEYLARGRFRVQSGLDEASARKLAAELGTLGARVSIAAAGQPQAAPPRPQPKPGGGTVMGLGMAPPLPASTPPPLPRAPAAPSPRPAPVPQATPAPVSVAAPVSPPTNSARNVAAPVISGGQRFESGLAAGFGAEASAVGDDPSALGSLQMDIGLMSLSALDGSNDEAPQRPQASADDGELDLDGPALSDDAFSAPDAGTPEDEALDVEPIHVTPVPGKSAVGLAAAAPALEEVPLVMPEAHGPLPAAPSAQGIYGKAINTAGPAHGVTALRPNGTLEKAIELFHDSARARWVVGVVLAVVVGFLPAWLYGSVASESRYDKVVRDVGAAYAAADTRDRWEALSAPGGATEVGQQAMQRAQFHLRTTSSLLWLVAAGTFAWFWRKKFIEEED